MYIKESPQALILVRLCVHLFFFLLTIHIGIESLGHMVTLYLNFKENLKLFSKVSEPFYILTSNMKIKR